VDTAKSELHELLSKPTLAGIPLLVLGNKNDLPGRALLATILESFLPISAAQVETFRFVRPENSFETTTRIRRSS